MGWDTAFGVSPGSACLFPTSHKAHGSHRFHSTAATPAPCAAAAGLGSAAGCTSSAQAVGTPRSQGAHSGNTEVESGWRCCSAGWAAPHNPLPLPWGGGEHPAPCATCPGQRGSTLGTFLMILEAAEGEQRGKKQRTLHRAGAQHIQQGFVPAAASISWGCAGSKEQGCTQRARGRCSRHPRAPLPPRAGAGRRLPPVLQKRMEPRACSAPTPLFGVAGATRGRSP